jgi:hypothetical protein
MWGSRRGYRLSGAGGIPGWLTFAWDTVRHGVTTLRTDRPASYDY